MFRGSGYLEWLSSDVNLITDAHPMASDYQPLSTSDSPDQSTDRLNSQHTPAWYSKYTRPLLLVFAFIILAYTSFKAGQWSASIQPSPSLPNEQEPTTAHPSIPQPTAMTGKYSVGYFTNWGIYGRKYPPSLIPVQDLTHILYAFANIRPDTGEVYLSDLWADQDIHYPGDSWNDSGTNLYGNFKAIYKLKKANRHLKVLLSIGGWTYSPSIHPVVINPAARANFVDSAVKLLEDYGLDGLDVDYEYPSNDQEAQGYVCLLQELRVALDKCATQKQPDTRFLLTIAAPCGPENYKKLHVAEMDKSLDFWNLMAYDFSGSWDNAANNQANIYGPPINANDAIQFYNSNGVAHSKLILGVPLYGRSFTNTKGPGQSFSGVGPGTWESGVYDYRVLPLPGSYVYRDESLIASWTYDPDRKEMVSFDNEEVAKWKGQYIKNRGLGGSMFWELSGDKGAPRDGMEGGFGKELQPGKSLVKIVKDAMGGISNTNNCLQYNGSKFDNMRKGMPS